jgi:pyruvate dehydrogenase E2 component (dihydrolipoamide acetyltransferase)
MTIEVFMPALSPTMEEGTLAKWLVKEGDDVKAGDVIAEIETDKATMEVEAADEGKVGKIVVEAGTENVPVGKVIAVLLEEGEDAGDLGEVKDQAADKKQEAAKEPEAPKKEEPKQARTEQESDVAPAKKVEAKAPPAPSDSKGGRVFASPLARRLAEQSGIDLSTIEGSGPGGRIVKKDLEGKAAMQKPSAEAAAETGAAPVSTPDMGDIPVEEVKLSAMRKVIAKRLTESKQTVPHFYLTVDVEMDRLIALRKEVNADEGVKLSVNDFLIKALAGALMKVPEANVQFAGDSLLKFGRADISVAVAIEGGLITPVIKGANTKGVATIGQEMKDLAARAREGKLKPEEYQGGTASLSNLGMYGIKQFDAVINPPQATILAVGSAEQRPVVRDGELVPATVMTATLSCDHRAVDGAVGSELLTAFKSLIENPIRILL